MMSLNDSIMSYNASLAHLLFYENYASFDSRQFPLQIYQLRLRHRREFVEECVSRYNEFIEEGLHAFRIECCHCVVLCEPLIKDIKMRRWKL